MGVWEGVTVVSNCESPQLGVKSIDKCVILWKIVMIMKEVNRGLGRCDSHQGGVTVIREV